MNGFLRERKIVAEVGCVGPPTPILPSLGYPEARATGAGALWQLLQCTPTCSWRTSLPSPQHYCSAAQPTHRPTRRIRLSLRASGQRPTRKPARCRASWQRRWRPSRPRAKRSNRAGRVGQQHRGEHKPYTPSWGSGRHPPPGPLFCAHRVAAQRGHKSHSLPVPKTILFGTGSRLSTS